MEIVWRFDNQARMWYVCTMAKPNKHPVGNNLKGNPNIVAEGEAYQWQPGQSGNPKGRPRSIYTVTTMLQELLTGNYQDVVARWRKAGKLTGAQDTAIVIFEAAIAGDKSLIRELLDRTEGRPVQPIDMAGELNVKGIADLVVVADGDRDDDKT